MHANEQGQRKRTSTLVYKQTAIFDSSKQSGKGLKGLLNRHI